MGSTHTWLHSSLVRKLFLFPPSPPHQNLVQPPYSMSKLQRTTKSLFGPRSFSSPQTSGGATGRSWSSHPAKFTPVAVEFPSGQQPYSLAAQPQPSWSTPCNKHVICQPDINIAYRGRSPPVWTAAELPVLAAAALLAGAPGDALPVRAAAVLVCMAGTALLLRPG